MTKTQKWIVIGLSSLLIGGIGFMIYKNKKKKSEQKTTSNSGSDAKTSVPTQEPNYNAKSATELQNKKVLYFADVTTQSTGLKLRNSASSTNNNNVVTLIPKGARVSILAHDTTSKSNWVPVVYTDKQSLKYYGYVDKNYLKIVSDAQVKKEIDELFIK